MKTAERLATLENQVLDIKEDLRKAELELKEFKKDISKDYAKNKSIEKINTKLGYISKSFVRTVLTIFTGVLIGTAMLLIGKYL